LINKLNIRDYNELLQAEADIGFLKLINIDSLEYNKLNDELKKLNIAKNKIEKEVLEITYKIKSLEQIISEFDKLKTGLCETCIEVFNQHNRIK
jgi:predicted transcriptional regulator